VLCRDAEGGLDMQARRREGGREDSDAAAEGTGQPALLPRDQRASERASAKTREKREERRERRTDRRERRERRERERPTKHTRKPTPAPSAKGEGADSTGRDAPGRVGV
jgi:hypothetical protein